MTHADLIRNLPFHFLGRRKTFVKTFDKGGVCVSEEIQKLIEHMKSNDFTPPDDISFDNHFHRFPRNSKYKDRAAWLIAKSLSFGNKQIIVAHYGDWRDSGDIKYHYITKSDLSDSEKESFQTLKAEQEKILQNKMRALRKESATEAAKVWNESQSPNPEHPYLKRKKIDEPLGIRQNALGHLIIPLRDINGTITSIQFINANETDNKRFLQNGKKTYFQFGEISQTVNFCEGYATGYSVHKVTGLCTVCAMDARNLRNAVKDYLKKYPKIDVVICADRDPNKTGEIEAKNAIEGIDRAKIILPPEGFKDFNDAYIAGATFAIEKAASVIDFTTTLTDTVTRFNKKVNLPTLQNLKDMCNRVGAVVRYNVLTREEEIQVRDWTFLCDLQKLNSYELLRNFCVYFGVSKSMVDDNLNLMAAQNFYNPVMDWVLSRPWDGVSRLENFYGTLKSDWDNEESTREFKKVLMKKWLVGALKAASSPNGCSVHGTLVLQGAQGKGKTSWVKRLVPENIELVKTEGSLHMDDKDSKINCLKYWIFELAEIDSTFRKSDISSLKAFLTSEKDDIRRPFDRKNTVYYRRTVFIGTVNENNFLHDSTGNRRFWTIPINDVDYMHTIDMQQLWAEVWNGIQTQKWEAHINQKELLMLNELNEEFESESGYDLLLNTLDWQSDRGSWVDLAMFQIFNLFEMDMSKLSKSDVTRMGMALRKRKIEKRKTDSGRFYRVPRIKSDSDLF